MSILIFLLVSWSAWAEKCEKGKFRVFFQEQVVCAQRIPEPQNDLSSCAADLPQVSIENFPFPLKQEENLPWWAQQGNLFFPNLHFPGPWRFPFLEAQYYPGEGEVFAAKPNVYVQSVHQEQKFSLSFESEGHLSFLATTPPLESRIWKGKITHGDLFEMDGVNYDYLFYDIRLPKSHMQFDHGLCASRAEVIRWMIKDLKEMGYSELAQQDFDEHWRVKIPHHPMFCVYPQYNQQLDKILPVKISLDQVSFIRSLFILVAHESLPETSGEIPLPQQDPILIRPETKISRENMFREWGVAFFGR